MKILGISHPHIVPPPFTQKYIGTYTHARSKARDLCSVITQSAHASFNKHFAKINELYY